MNTLFSLKAKQVGWALAAAVLLLPGIAAAAPAATWTELNISPNPVNAGTDATLTGKLYLGTQPNTSSPLSGRVLKIEMLQSGLETDAYNPANGVACNQVGNWQQVPPVNEVTGSGSYPAGQVIKTFDTTSLAGKLICFRTNHSAAGGDYAASQSGGINLDIRSACTGVTLSNPQVTGGTSHPNGSVGGPWTITMRLTNCLGVDRDFKVQGGANAWAPLNTDDFPISTSSGSQPEVKGKNKNSVIVWNVTTGGTPQDITFTVGSAATILPCGGASGITQYLTGPWSAAYTDPTTNLPAKSDYTARATVSSGACVP